MVHHLIDKWRRLPTEPERTHRDTTCTDRRHCMEIRNASPQLYNEDLAPTTAKERTWGAFSIFNVWTSDVHSLWGYYLAASLFLLCGSFINFVLAIGLSRW
jgi:cytosine/uracil/thiamine/allantoin permease